MDDTQTIVRVILILGLMFWSARNIRQGNKAQAAFKYMFACFLTWGHFIWVPVIEAIKNLN